MLQESEAGKDLEGSKEKENSGRVMVDEQVDLNLKIF